MASRAALGAWLSWLSVLRRDRFIVVTGNRLSGVLVLLGFGGEEHCHPLAFEDWHLLDSGDIFEVVGESEEEDFALLLEEDRASPEEDVGLNFGSLFNELLGVLELEGVVVVVGLRAETNLLDDGLYLLGLDFLLLLLLLVEEFLVIEDSADRRVGRRGYFDEVEFEVVGEFHGVLYRVDARCLDVVANQTNLWDSDFVVNPVLGFRLLRASPALIVSAISAVARRTPIVIGGGIHYALRLFLLLCISAQRYASF